VKQKAAYDRAAFFAFVIERTHAVADVEFGPLFGAAAVGLRIQICCGITGLLVLSCFEIRKGYAAN
jgi:hypothetical protein